MTLFACGSGSSQQDAIPERGGPDEGRWHAYRTHQLDDGLTEEQRAAIESMEGLGYLDGKNEVDVPRGVTRHVLERAGKGVNLFNSAHEGGARLIDMEGQTLHTWAYPFREVWPDYPGSHKNRSFWRRTHLFENGDILAIYEGLGIIKIDKDSKLIWSSTVRTHHDLDLAPNGDLWVLTREAHVLPHIHKKKPVLEDFVSRLDSEGREVQRISILAALLDSEFRDLWSGKVWPSGNLFHTNSLERLDGSLAHVHPAFAEGNFLVSMRLTDMIAVLDPKAERIVWARTGSFQAQHDPTVLPNGRLQLFDNNPALKASKILELDPATGEELWVYAGKETDPFYSETCGLSQRLPGGNTLITESDYGRAFEVTPEGETVWEYYSPFSAGDNDEYIATMMEMVRLPADFNLDWVKNPTEEPASPTSDR